MYWCMSNGIEPENPSYLMKHYNSIKQQLYKNLLIYFKKTKMVLNCENQNYSINHVLKYNNYDVIYKPYISYKNFYSNELILVKNENEKYDVIVPTTNSKNNVEYYKLLASFYKFSINLDVIDNIYFLPSQSNYLNKKKWYSYNYIEKAVFDNKINLIYSSITNSKDLTIGETIFPNMKNKEDFPYHTYKKQIASITDEITQYYYCNYNHRNHYMKYNKGKQYSSKNFGVKNLKTNVSKMRDRILSNRNLKFETKLNNFKLNNFKLDKNTNYLFIDFEAIPNLDVNVDNLENIRSINGIYNIGVFIKTYNSENFISLYSECLDDKKIVSEFMEILNTYNSNNNCYIFHWSSAELSFLKQYESKYNLSLNLQNYNFIDLYNVFIEKKIVIKGAKSFKLKDIANAIGIIDENTEVDDGIETIGLFLNDFINNTIESKEKIQKYNENDCKYLFELLKIV